MHRIFLRYRSRVYSTVLDCSVVRTQALSLKIMIIGDWRRRSSRKATKSHLENIPDFSPNIPDFSPQIPDFSPNVCVAGCHSTYVILDFFSPNIPDFYPKIKQSPGLCGAASPCSCRLRSASSTSRRPRGGLLPRGSLQQGDGRLSVRTTGFFSKHTGIFSTMCCCPKSIAHQHTTFFSISTEFFSKNTGFFSKP